MTHYMMSIIFKKHHICGIIVILFKVLPYIKVMDGWQKSFFGQPCIPGAPVPSQMLEQS